MHVNCLHSAGHTARQVVCTTRASQAQPRLMSYEQVTGSKFSTFTLVNGRNYIPNF